ncbi:acyltransferase family protein [Corynebacterium durum]|uniref:acyltransferase family protein n=1 Tax=Corynebacterium durum TaxID=61592 RepID=UPI004024BFCC
MAVGQLKSSPPSSTPSPSRRPNLPSLTGARWWAAMLVYVLHALVFLPVYPFQKSELFRQIHTVVPMQLGSAGVTFFFILSGFLIYWSNSEVSGVSDALYYCRRRLTKIFPMHLITLVMFVLASATVTASSITWALSFDRLKVWLPNALLIHTWNPDWAVLGGMNVPSWSLCAEMLFYLTFPLFVPLVRRVRGRGNWWALGAMFAVSLGIITVVHLFADGPKTTENFFVPRLWPQDVSPVADVHADPVWFSQDHIPVLQSYWLSYYFPLTRLVEFYLGVFAAKLVWEKQFHNTDLTLPLILLGMSYGTTWFVPIAFKMSVLMSLPMTYVIATLAVRDIEGVSRFIASPRSVLLGNISFAFYMVQFPVMVFVQRYFVAGGEYGFFGWLLAAVGSFVLSVALAWVLFTFVDDPLMRATARKPARRPAHAATRTW